MKRLVGIGSPHGDDAVGWAAVARLRHDPATKGWACDIADGGQGLLDLLEECIRLVLIDGVRDENSPPGTVHRLTWPDPRVESIRPASTHLLGIPEALKLAEALGQLPGQVTIFAVAVADCSPNAGLSESVVAALPGLLEEVRRELTD